MAEITLTAKKREISNKGANKELRRNGVIPCIYYSKDKEPIAFSVEEIALKPLVYTSQAHIINLTFENEEPIGAIIKDVQFDPVTDRVVHADFHGVTLGQMIDVQIPINIIGSAVGVKEGGMVQQNIHKLDVECLPRHIPQHLDVDVSELEIGDSIHIRDLNFEDINILNHDDTIVISVVAPRGEEVEEEAEEVEGEVEGTAEPEVIAKGKADEEDNKKE
ncbi:LSU ribosomal protein L25p [hydrothermal vent metagenome]|uniref:LSU ribosomal protein L25p n=1 Tax=hydrothermal vent metagenome TaxID=652676 RepID=A0A3B1CEX1_9ZZZZ